MTDEELAELKAETKRNAEENRRLAQQQAQRDQVYQNDMRVVAQHLQARQAPAPVVDEPEDDSTMTRESIRRIVQEEVSQPAARIGTSLLEQQRDIARLTIPDYAKYSGEVEALVQRALAANPNALTDPGLYRNAVEVVRVQHFDEIVEERVNARLRPQHDVEDDGDDAPATARADSAPASASSPPAQHREPLVAPSGAQARTAPVARRSRVVLSEEEQKWATRAGLSPEEFDTYGDPKYNRDVLGLRDANGRLRDAV